MEAKTRRVGRLTALAMGCGLALGGACDAAGEARPADAVGDAARGLPGGDVVGDGDAAGPPAPPLELWPEGPDFAPTGGLVERVPQAFERVSGWVTRVGGPLDSRPDTGHRGGYGAGNGHVFALFGLTDPLNTMHGMVGPTYERGERFFGDYAIGLVTPGGEPARFDDEWAAWSLSAPAVLTRGQLRVSNGGLRLDTVDFAPARDQVDHPARHCMVRALMVTNRGETAASGWGLRVRAHSAVAEGARLRESSIERVLWTGFSDGAGEAVGAELIWPVPPLAAGASAEVALLHCAHEGADTQAELPAVDVDAALAEVAAEHAAYRAGLVSWDLPDPMAADALEGLLMALRVQTAITGANCPMSQYTRIWARDTIGPALAWLTLGAHGDVEAMLDYLYGAVLDHGDLKNSYDSDLAVDPNGAEPDWASKGTLGAAVAAETPSYMVWEYGALARHTGETDRAAARWGFLTRSLMDQAFGPGGELPFTGDETFRAAMNATFGLDLEHPHHVEHWSLNSMLLWLGAETHYQRLASLLDAPAAAAAAQREVVEATVWSHFALGDGCLGALADRGSGEVWPAPFEDVQLKLTWAGAADGDDPRVHAATECLLEAVGVAPGRVQSPIDAMYVDHPVIPNVEGVYTGMLPGYTLSALTSVGHPEAAAAFDALGESLGTSGQTQEYQIADDHSGLSLIYDPSGFLTDYTAKFRPWEGGIALAAALEYLVGWDPDALAGTVGLRPHLPNGWPELTVRGLRAGDARFDVTVRRADAGHHEVVVSTDSSTGWVLHLRWDLETTADATFTVDGQPVDPSLVERRGAFGRASLLLTPLELRPGATRTVRVE